ncbi:MAG: dethiobiotin synthase [Caulobacter sp.]|nr:dethiobiotin synthase [Caulobacter sp.]
MRTVFIAGAGTDVGKTWVAAGLISALRAEGASVDAFKLIASGYDPARPEDSDAAVLLAALGRAPTPEAIEDICPLRFIEPLSPPAAARREGVTLSLADLVSRCRQRMAAAATEVLLIEGAGGVMSPVTDDATVLDVIVAARTPTVLVGGSYLGAISHILTAADVLASRGVKLEAVVVSESLAPAPDFDETLRDISRLLKDSTVVGVRRDDPRPLTGLARRILGASLSSERA